MKSNNISAAAIHGDKSQGVRSRVLSAFKDNKLRILVATDVAARGLDINELPLVVNFDLPKVAEDYIHRIGRTGRAGLSGQGVSLVSADEVKLLAAIEVLINKTLERETETGFVPTHKVPLTRQIKAGPRKPKNRKRSRKRSKKAVGRLRGERSVQSSRSGGAQRTANGTTGSCRSTSAGAQYPARKITDCGPIKTKVVLFKTGKERYQ